MKKRTLFIFFLLLMLASVGFAQGTYLLPLQGETHTYTATVTDPESNNPVRWYVSDDAMGTWKADTTDQYRFVTAGYSEPDSVLAGTAVYSVEIFWNPSVTAGADFYVYIEVDDDASGCTNRMGLHVTISADFNALVYDVTGSASPGTVDPSDPAEDIEEESCPGEVQNPLWDGDSHTDIGFSEMVFRVEKRFSLLAWQFEYEISEADAEAFTIENVRIVDEGGSELYNGTNGTGIVAVDADEDYVLIYVQITNQMGVTLDMDMDLLTDGNNTKDSDDNLDSNPADNHADHVIEPMPVISGFSGS